MLVALLSPLIRGSMTLLHWRYFIIVVHHPSVGNRLGSSNNKGLMCVVNGV